MEQDNHRSSGGDSQPEHSSCLPKAARPFVAIRPEKEPSRCRGRIMRRYAIQKDAAYSLRDAARVLRIPVSQVRRAILLNELLAIEVSDDRQYVIQGEDLEEFLRVLEPRAIIEDGHLNGGGDSIWAIAVLILIPLLALVSLIIGVLAAPASTPDAPASPGPKASSPQVLPEYGSDLNMPPELNPSNQHEDAQRLQNNGEFAPKEKSASPLPVPSPLYKGWHRLDVGPAEVMECSPRES